MNWDKILIKNQFGNNVEAQAPIIISASRATDIPAFYSDWLVNRIKVGYVKWKNPFSGSFLHVTFSKARLFVFWSKNPKPIIKKLDFFDERKLNYYFQFSLNNYDLEKLEPRVPNVDERIDTFIELSEKIGKDKVIWRFDPLILTDLIGVDELLRKAEYVGNKLKNHTSRLVFSYADINHYKKVKSNLINNSIKYQDFGEFQMYEFAKGIKDLNKKWNFELATCAEKIELESYGINKNKCIDDDLIIKLFSSDTILMDLLKVKIIPPDLYNSNIRIEKLKDNKDKGQRDFCGCITSKDIGEYNTCPHFCLYCYANFSSNIVKCNLVAHKKNQLNETITGL